MAKEERARVQLTMSPQLLARIDRYCERIGVYRSAWIQTVLAERLDQLDAVRATGEVVKSHQK